MQRPIDQADRSHLVHKAVLNGDYELKNILFQYGEEDPRPSLAIRHLKFARRKIAILGRNGAGKSTLLQLLSGYAGSNSGSCAFRWTRSFLN